MSKIPQSAAPSSRCRHSESGLVPAAHNPFGISSPCAPCRRENPSSSRSATAPCFQIFSVSPLRSAWPRAYTFVLPWDSALARGCSDFQLFPPSSAISPRSPVRCAVYFTGPSSAAKRPLRLPRASAGTPCHTPVAQVPKKHFDPFTRNTELGICVWRQAHHFSLSSLFV